MMSLNRAQLIGNLTRDPELRTTTSGQTVANFSVATSSVWTDSAGQRQEKTEFHNIVAWGKLADICGQYLVKGRRVFVEGRLQTRDWETQDGQKRQKTEVVADNVIMLDRPPQGGAPASAGSIASASAPTYAPIAPMAPAPAVDKTMGEQEIKVEDIPF
ncbi:MAG TPA: single-stranded DNA-binding protein [Candidatus Methylomirabilis sp.]|nr:single-stranded DNA-binding protein [Candidatus Methylomirabilis sp.]